MEWWQIAFLVLATSLTLMAVTAFIIWRMASGRTRRLTQRLQALPWQERFTLAASLSFDERLPPLTRLLLPAVVLYLCLPIDLIPDFVPVVGQVDDAVAVGVGIGLMRGSRIWKITEAYLAEREAAAFSSEPRRRNSGVLGRG
jgi:uncharacterized membrane protein YkvA (DUF1232 family)